MLFSVSSNDLKEALSLFKPIPRRKEENDDDQEYHEFYFGDKVVFELMDNSVALSVSCDGIRIRKEIEAVVNEKGVRFCVPFFELYNRLPPCEAVLKFEEVRFFGFDVYAQGLDYKFELEAYTVRQQRKQLADLSEFSFKEFITLEKDFLLKSLSDISIYGNDDSQIVYRIRDGVCVVSTSANNSVGIFRYPIAKKKPYAFFIPNKLGLDGISIIEKIDNISISLYYNNETLVIQEEDFLVELKQPKDFKLDIIDRFLSVNESDDHFTVSKKAIEDFLKKADILEEGTQDLSIHAVDKYMTIHCYNYFAGTGIHEIAPSMNVSSDIVVNFNRFSFVKFLRLIHTENIRFFLSKNKYLYVLDEEEDVNGNELRLLNTWTYYSDRSNAIKKESDELIEKIRNQELQSVKESENAQEDSPDEEEDGTASKEEMIKEAIARMQKVIKMKPIITAFAKTGNPQVYEPPYGASYALEDEEMDKIRKMESRLNIVIWGVIRSFLTYNRQEVTVDHMLFVSHNKDDWEQERKNLYDGCPLVYTEMKEYPINDHGSINIQASPGGTLLRI